MRTRQAVTMLRDYRVPGPKFIARGRVGSLTERLYQQEDKVAEGIKASATTWAKIQNVPHDGPDLWTQAMPQALFDVLERFDPNAAQTAAAAFLRQYGWRCEAATPTVDS